MVKHKQYNELGDPVPGASCWGLSLLALAAFLVLTLWGQMAFTGLRYARLQEHFSRLARDGENLHRLVDDQRFQPILSQHKDAFKALLPVISLVNKGKLSQALKVLDRNDTPRHPLMTRLKERLGELADEDSRYQDADLEEADNSELRQSLEKSYREAYIELSSALDTKEINADGITTAKGFYDSGVLKSLPVVDGIPDNIDSFENLEMYAHRFRDYGERERKLFFKNLDGLRARCAQLKPQIEDMLVKSEIRNSRSKLLAQSRKASIREAQQILSHILPEFTRLALSPSLVDAYRQLEEIGQNFGVSVPKLKLT